MAANVRKRGTADDMCRRGWPPRAACKGRAGPGPTRAMRRGQEKRPGRPQTPTVRPSGPRCHGHSREHAEGGSTGRKGAGEGGGTGREGARRLEAAAAACRAALRMGTAWPQWGALQAPGPCPSPGAATVLTPDRPAKTNVCLVCFLGLFHSRQKSLQHTEYRKDHEFPRCCREGKEKNQTRNKTKPPPVTRAPARCSEKRRQDPEAATFSVCLGGRAFEGRQTAQQTRARLEKSAASAKSPLSNCS